jgi:hypothetical protein
VIKKAICKIEFVGRKRKTAEEKSKEHNPITARGLGNVLSAREDDWRRSDEEPLPLGLVQIGFLELRRNLLGHRAAALLLCHLLLVHKLLRGHSEEMRSGDCEETKEHKEDEAMAAAKEQRVGKQ